MSITNISKPTTTLTNETKVAFYETWASIQTTWATETRTWLDCASIIENTTRQSSTITNVSKP